MPTSQADKTLPQLLSVAEARTRILEHFQPLTPETIPITQAAGRVLAEDIAATQDLPPFTNSSMDGYAVRWREVAGASAEQPLALRVSGDIPAGAGVPAPLIEGTAMRIMTGAPIPEGADAVVPVEDTDDEGSRTGGPAPDVVRIFKAAKAGANLRPIGQDMRAGEVVLRAGTSLRPAAVGVLAALGYTHVSVYCQPLIAIFSTGNELCEIEET
ncbi:MAG: molybdopterin molybdotransferase MoeA, partial [Anaerolineales bacterium]